MAVVFKAKNKGKEILMMVNSCTINVDLNNLYTKVEINSSYEVPPLTEIDYESKTQLVVLSSSFTGDSYDLVCVSKAQYQVLTKSLSSYIGNSTFKSVCSAAGIKTIAKVDSPQQFFLIPDTFNVLDFLRYLNEYVNVQGSTCTMYHLNISGEIIAVDMTSTNNQVDVQADVESDISDTSWFASHPMSFNIIKSTTSQLGAEDLNPSDKHSLNKASINATAFYDEYVDMPKNKAQKDFYTHYYMSRVIEASSIISQPLKLGDYIKLNRKVSARVRAIRYNLPVTTEHVHNDATFVTEATSYLS